MATDTQPDDRPRTEAEERPMDCRHSPSSDVHKAAAGPRDEGLVWLIERGQPEGLTRAQWWGVTDSRTGAYGWVDSAFAADQFDSEADARAVIAGFDRPGHPFHARAVQHGFIEAEAAAGPRDALREALKELAEVESGVLRDAFAMRPDLQRRLRAALAATPAPEAGSLDLASSDDVAGSEPWDVEADTDGEDVAPTTEAPPKGRPGMRCPECGHSWTWHDSDGCRRPGCDCKRRIARRR